MSRADIDKSVIINKAVELANEIGFEKVTLKLLASNLNIKPPSLYNHINGLEDLQKEVMLYGWKQLEERVIEAAIGVTGYDALEAMGRAFYKYSTENPGVFDAMLWYNKFQSDEMQDATKRIFSVIYKIFSTLNISQENCDHLIRTYRAFLEGYILLVNNNAFGHPLSIEDSFEISLKVLKAGTKTLERKDDEN